MADVSSQEPRVPAVPEVNVTGTVARVIGDMDQMHLTYALQAVIVYAYQSSLLAQTPSIYLRLSGDDFALDENDRLVGGVAKEIVYEYYASPGGQLTLDLDVKGVPLISLADWALRDAVSEFYDAVFSGDDRLYGNNVSQLIRGFAGDDYLIGNGGDDTIWGGPGDDVIRAGGLDPKLPPASTYVRGEEGNDYIVGGVGFDDSNGNQGDDTVVGGLGDDWSVGGKDDDLLFGDEGSDIVWGNIGNDTCVGGVGADQVRGGQGNDVVYGGAGDDYVSGDIGDDYVIGGAGADRFHGFAGIGGDRILDFNAAEGDRVLLDPGTAYSAAQVGADAVITLTGGQMILVGVQLAALPQGWIYESW